MADVEFRTVEDGVGMVTLNRPASRNAISTGMRHDLTAILLSQDLQALRAVVIVGAGGTFSAGVDLKEMAANGDIDDYADVGRLLGAFRRAKPVIIAAVQGYAMGLGAGIAMATDVAIAGDDAQFAYREIEYGLVAGIVMVRLKELVSQRQAMDLLLTGRRVGAAEALRMGLVNEVVPSGETVERALLYARQLAGRSSLAVHTTKMFFHEATDMTYDSAVHAAERILTQLRHSKEGRAGVSAFGQTREPSNGS